MDKKTEEEIVGSLEEGTPPGVVVIEGLDNFEGEIWLSTDGKLTVRMKAETPEGRFAGAKWAKDTYEAIVKRYGTKQAQAVREYKKPEEPIEEAVEKVKQELPRTKVCNECGGIRTYKTGVKNGRKWAAWFCENDACKPEWVGTLK